jgi:hypothetical protein
MANNISISILDELFTMVHSNSSFGILLFGEKLNIPARQVRAPKLMELVRAKPYNYSL